MYTFNKNRHKVKFQAKSTQTDEVHIESYNLNYVESDNFNKVFNESLFFDSLKGWIEDKVHIKNKEYSKFLNSRKRIQLSERKLIENTLRPSNKIPEDRFIYREECNYSYLIII